MSEPACVFKDGQIWWRGCYRSREDAVRLAEQFERHTAVDWFIPHAAEFAKEVRAAIARHDNHHSQRETA